MIIKTVTYFAVLNSLRPKASTLLCREILAINTT